MDMGLISYCLHFHFSRRECPGSRRLLTVLKLLSIIIIAISDRKRSTLYQKNKRAFEDIFTNKYCIKIFKIKAVREQYLAEINVIKANRLFESVFEILFIMFPWSFYQSNRQYPLLTPSPPRRTLFVIFNCSPLPGRETLSHFPLVSVIFCFFGLLCLTVYCEDIIFC